MELLASTILFCSAAALTFYLSESFLFNTDFLWIFPIIMFVQSIRLFLKYKKKES